MERNLYVGEGAFISYLRHLLLGCTYISWFTDQTEGVLHVNCNCYPDSLLVW